MSRATQLNSVSDAMQKFLEVLPWLGDGDGPGQGVDLVASYGKKFNL